MQPRARKYLGDIRDSSESIVEFTTGIALEEFEASRLIQRAVEPEFTIIGEALMRLARVEPEMAARISDYRRIIGFRNVLTHDYGDIQKPVIWDAVETRLPILHAEVAALLAEE